MDFWFHGYLCQVSEDELGVWDSIVQKESCWDPGGSSQMEFKFKFQGSRRSNGGEAFLSSVSPFLFLLSPPKTNARGWPGLFHRYILQCVGNCFCQLWQGFRKGADKFTSQHTQLMGGNLENHFTDHPQCVSDYVRTSVQSYQPTSGHRMST